MLFYSIEVIFNIALIKTLFVNKGYCSTLFTEKLNTLLRSYSEGVWVHEFKYPLIVWCGLLKPINRRPLHVRSCRSQGKLQTAASGTKLASTSNNRRVADGQSNQ